MLNLGSSEVLAMKVGAQNVVAVYLGSTLVWSDGARLRGASVAHSSLTGALSVHRSFAGGISAHALLAGALRLAGEVEFGGALAAQSALVGALSVQRNFAGDAAAISSMAGDLEVEETTAPTIVTSDSYNSGGTSVDPIPVPLPASIVSGNKLVVIVATGGAAVLTTPSGWSLLGVYGTTGAFDRRIRVYERIADGSEGATLNIDQTASNSVSSVYSIQVAGSASATLIQGADGTGVDPDPPNNNPGASAATLWIAACSKRQTSAISAPPSGYSQIEVAEWSSNMSGAAASKTSTASNEDPGVFSGSGSDKWAAVTLGFRA